MHHGGVGWGGAKAIKTWVGHGVGSRRQEAAAVENLSHASHDVFASG